MRGEARYYSKTSLPGTLGVRGAHSTMPHHLFEAKPSVERQVMTDVSLHRHYPTTPTIPIISSLPFTTTITVNFHMSTLSIDDVLSAHSGCGVNTAPAKGLLHAGPDHYPLSPDSHAGTRVPRIHALRAELTSSRSTPAGISFPTVFKLPLALLRSNHFLYRTACI